MRAYNILEKLWYANEVSEEQWKDWRREWLTCLLDEQVLYSSRHSHAYFRGTAWNRNQLGQTHKYGMWISYRKHSCSLVSYPTHSLSGNEKQKHATWGEISTAVCYRLQLQMHPCCYENATLVPSTILRVRVFVHLPAWLRSTAEDDDSSFFCSWDWICSTTIIFFPPVCSILTVSWKRTKREKNPPLVKEKRHWKSQM